MTLSHYLMILTLTFISIVTYSKGFGPKRGPASVNEDGKVLSCTVEFRTKGGVTWFQTQKQAWQLPEKKGFIELKSIADVEVGLTKETTGKTTSFSLSIKQGKNNLGEIKADHRSFEYMTLIDAKIEDGEDGWKADAIRVACESTVMAN